MSYVSALTAVSIPELYRALKILTLSPESREINLSNLGGLGLMHAVDMLLSGTYWLIHHRVTENI